MNTKTTRPFEMWTAWDCLGRHDCRPVIVISQEGDTDTVTVIPLTSDRESTQLPTHVLISEQGLAGGGRHPGVELTAPKTNHIINN